jgi:hypothetical protein
MTNDVFSHPDIDENKKNKNKNEKFLKEIFRVYNVQSCVRFLVVIHRKKVKVSDFSWRLKTYLIWSLDIRGFQTRHVGVRTYVVLGYFTLRVITGVYNSWTLFV